MGGKGKGLNLKKMGKERRKMERWVELKRKYNDMRPVGSQEVNRASVILLSSMLMKPADQW